ncbi:hypothetical protein [Corallococcus aberystwythensis]|uniref:Uncharacterized protein n=1 Tax=Corallococcus aberystwythensis TaxID=2316722 RepID=A0A3A8QMN9_9BACT|nr:hypothetical protein [Corallococcus aberystwythensis]RKH70016.1 hypothetical protein D7W81_10075 [Corallococcus aberystwythensis]
MSTFRPALCATFAAGLLLAAPAAEARFGKKSPDTSDSKKDDDKGGSKVHAATPIRSGSRDEAPSRPAPSRDDDCCYSAPARSRPSYSARIHGDAVLAAAELLTIAVEASDPGPSMAVREQRAAPPLDVRMGLNVGAMGGGTAGDVFLGIEGEALGIVVQGTQLTLPTDDGTAGTDDLRLVSMHLTWAALSTDRMRWRFEGGVSTAHAPDVLFVGPSLATSLEVCVVGPLDLEARVQGTAGTYRQLDASAGLALHLGALNLRGGVRGLILDDAGQVDGIQHVDRFVGPYAGAGFVF